MTGKTSKIAVCSCEKTMSLDIKAIAAGCRHADITTADHLCRSEMARFQALAKGGNLIVACTQEAAHFAATAGESGLDATLTFANIRESAGWSSEGERAGPKMAALLAAAAIADQPVPHVTFESEGIALIYGCDDQAVELGRRLKDRLDITVLITGKADIAVPATQDFPIRRGSITKATGHFGAFELVVEGLSEPAASSRRRLEFGAPRGKQATSRADIVIDISGTTPLFAAPDLREGYLRADPGDSLAIERLAFAASDLVGTFDKPRYIDFKSELCAHQRSRITGCRRCLDLCPAGAIAPAGNHVAIDPFLCGGCGACASVCPTGAANYALPATDIVLARLRAALQAYHQAGGTRPALLFHDAHGSTLIAAAARSGDGLPANVIPLAVNEIGRIGLETVAAAFAYGATAFHILSRRKPAHPLDGTLAMLTTANTLLAALGFGDEAARLISADDPEAMSEALAQPVSSHATTRPATFMPVGSQRDLLKLSLRELHRCAPAPVDRISLPAGSAFGAVRIDAPGCTLCHACVSACPTGALTSLEDRPALRFDESLCVQCGLCKATCPEKVITLEAQLDFNAFEAGPRLLKEEEPFCCVNCGKAFGTKSSIEKVLSKLEGKHWMFAGDNTKRLDLIRMCEECRIEASVNESFDPYGAPSRPKLRTTEDYLREREEADTSAKREADMIERIRRGEV